MKTRNKPAKAVIQTSETTSSKQQSMSKKKKKKGLSMCLLRPESANELDPVN